MSAHNAHVAMMQSLTRERRARHELAVNHAHIALEEIQAALQFENEAGLDKDSDLVATLGRCATQLAELLSAKAAPDAE